MNGSVRTIASPTFIFSENKQKAPLCASQFSVESGGRQHQTGNVEATSPGGKSVAAVVSTSMHSLRKLVWSSRTGEEEKQAQLFPRWQCNELCDSLYALGECLTGLECFCTVACGIRVSGHVWREG